MYSEIFDNDLTLLGNGLKVPVNILEPESHYHFSSIGHMGCNSLVFLGLSSRTSLVISKKNVLVSHYNVTAVVEIIHLTWKGT